MRRLATIAVIAALLGLVGCITPSIPIPPPDPARMTFNVTVVDLKSSAVFAYPIEHNYKNGIAYLYDRTLRGGVIHDVNPDDSIGPIGLPASLGDQVVVSVQVGDQTISTCVVLREGAQDPNSYCQ